MAKGFRALFGREPVAGRDFDPDGPMCQDDYEYFNDTGYYDGEEHCYICGADDRLELAGDGDGWLCAYCASQNERAQG